MWVRIIQGISILQRLQSRLTDELKLSRKLSLKSPSPPPNHLKQINNNKNKKKLRCIESLRTMIILLPNR